MQRRSMVLGAALAVLFAVSSFAATVTGKWVAKIEGKDGQTFEQVFELKAEGEALTGTVTGPMGMQSPIADGKVKDDEISFTVTRETPRGTMKMKYTGKVSGDELKLHMEREGGQGPGRDMTAKKAE